MSTHDKLRYKLMFEIVGKEVKNHFDLQNLVNDLESLVRSLEKIDVEWQKKFMEKWEILEEYNAVFYEDSDIRLFNECVININDVRVCLLGLITEKK